MNRMKSERGKLLYIGIKGTSTDTKKGKLFGFLESIFIFIIILIVSLGIWSGYLVSLIPLPLIIDYMIPVPCLIIALFILYITGSLEIDGIYENGLTHRWTTLTETLKGDVFHSYDNITKIGYGIEYKSKNNSPFIIIFENNSKFPTVRSYSKNDYKNDFYHRLLEILKNKCPKVKWEKIDLYNLPYWKR